MNTQEISQALADKKNGTIFTFTTRRPAKIRKSAGDMNIEKVAVMQGMVGTQYADRKPVREAVANGERDEVELPSHIQESFQVGKTRFWRGNNGNEYLPVCITGNKSQVTWLLDGEEVDFDAIKEHLLASEYAKSPSKEELADKGQVPFIGITVDNILAIH
jgi:hypothetical protein